MEKIHGSGDFRLQGETFLLRPWRIHEAEWYVASRDEAIFKWTKESRSLTVEEARQNIREANSDPRKHCFAIVENGAENPVGNIALVLMEEDTAAEVMYWLAPGGRGRGLAFKAVRLLSDWAFRSLGLEQIVLKTYRENSASRRVAARAGFRELDETDSPRLGTEYLWFERRRSGPELR